MLQLYFTWEQPWYQVVDEELFRKSKRTNGRYFSPLLLNCILALASRLSDRPEVRVDAQDPSTAGRVFLDAAEVLLHFEIRSPTITTLQSLAILGTLYVVSYLTKIWKHLTYRIRGLVKIQLDGFTKEWPTG